MTRVVWIYDDVDPLHSGELRRLGIPALALDGEEWLCDFVPAALITDRPEADIAVVAMSAARVVAQLSPTTKVIIEIDTRTALSHFEAAEVLPALSNRIAGAVARGIRAASWARDMLPGTTPIWIIPDPAARRVEIVAAALELGVPLAQPAAIDLPENFELWFCEPGDHIGSDEIKALMDAWRRPGAGRVVVATPLIGEWIRQMGVEATILPWSPSALEAALAKAGTCLFLGPKNYIQARRQVVALRSGATAPEPSSPAPALFGPARVTASWAEVLASVLAEFAPIPSEAERLRIMMHLDLIQDVDLALPLLEELMRREDVDLLVTASTWLMRHSPRAAEAIRSRGLSFQAYDRGDLASGLQPPLTGVDAVVVLAESSLAAHASSHALVNRARARLVPTFSLQHGVENVGLHIVASEGEASIGADHIFVWFPRGAAQAAPAAVRPRLVHVGRAVAPYQDLSAIRSTLAAFETVVVVFENLHWTRYDHDWRIRFLTDCAEFAAAHPTWAVILKPHHAGRWSVRHRHLIPMWPSNLIVADPTDIFWEPYSATALVQLADAVITTPSTVALDAAQAGKAVAVAAYGLELPLYAPLPLLQRLDDWSSFCTDAGSVDNARRRALFLSRTAVGDQVPAVTVDTIVAVAKERRRFRWNRTQLTAAGA